jgi:signal transduction histidine kinase/ActR/RegA family two-component response regulator
VGAALLAVFVAVVFVSLIAATNEARRVDRNSHAGNTLISAASSARSQVASAHARDSRSVKAAAQAAGDAARAADRSQLGTAAGNWIGTAARLYSRNPRKERRSLLAALDATIQKQQNESSRGSSELSDALTRALILGVIGLVGSVLSVILFGADMLRSVTVPVRRVAAAARRVGQGDLSTRVPESGVADLKALAISVNGMARSLEMSRQDLEASREDANQANQAKSEFLSRMSHELRTPLNAILGFAQLLEIDNLSSRQRDNVAHIVDGGKHLLDLINEVLEISRIEAGSMIPVLEATHAASIIRETVELVSPLAAQRGIELTTATGPHEDLWIQADQQRLKQVLLNLIANAVKYNRDGGKVTVSLKSAGGRGQIHVTDTGLGIAEEQLPKLFVPFERLGAEGGEVEGTGLGLVLALRLTQAMNGTLGVQSQPWIGSNFHVELPVAEAPAVAPVAAPAAEAAPVAAPAVAEPTEGTWRVLYVEDDRANARLMARLFQEEPRLELMTTMYGDRGVTIARELQPDLILLDIHLPDIDGDVVLQRLREDADARDIPVIVVSADATEEQRKRMTDLGAARYLTKPITLNALLSAIWEVLGSSGELLQAAEVSR